MSDVALKPFNTINRRFKAGDVIEAGDDLSPYGVETLKDRGFIGSSKPTLPPSLPVRAKIDAE